MLMEPRIIKAVLLSNDVKHLYHANSVVTALTYINNGGLMSRDFVERTGLPQTPQQTDESDKALDVYDDIFFDSVDLHVRMKNNNHYGPVLFVYSVDVLDLIPAYDVLITKDNPIHWDENILYAQKYFLSLPELENDFAKGNFGQHITIRHIDEPLTFDKLEKIILDYPGDDKIDYFNNAKSEIERALRYNNINVPVEVRKCSDDCKCKEKYRTSMAGYTYYRFTTKL